MTETIKIGCKINAYLKVVERLPNGYHNLSSLFLPLPFPEDTISINYDSNNAKEGEIITNSLTPSRARFSACSTNSSKS